MGIVWEAYHHKGGPLLGVPENPIEPPPKINISKTTQKTTSPPVPKTVPPKKNWGPAGGEAKKSGNRREVEGHIPKLYCLV